MKLNHKMLRIRLAQGQVCTNNSAKTKSSDSKSHVVVFTTPQCLS